MGSSLKKETKKPASVQTKAVEEVKIDKGSIRAHPKVDREAWEFLYKCKLTDRPSFLVMLAFIPIGKADFMPMLEKLRPGANKFYKDYIQDDLF